VCNGISGLAAQQVSKDGGGFFELSGFAEQISEVVERGNVTGLKFEEPLQQSDRFVGPALAVGEAAQ
jgi:hypothetical protein